MDDQVTVRPGAVIGEPQRPRIDEPTFLLIGGALCRAFDQISVPRDAGIEEFSELFWEIVGELKRVFPERDWRNIMTDQWPLGDNWPERVIAEWRNGTL